MRPASDVFTSQQSTKRVQLEAASLIPSTTQVVASQSHGHPAHATVGSGSGVAHSYAATASQQQQQVRQPNLPTRSLVANGGQGNALSGLTSSFVNGSPQNSGNLSATAFGVTNNSIASFPGTASGPGTGLLAGLITGMGSPAGMNVTPDLGFPLYGMGGVNVNMGLPAVAATTTAALGTSLQPSMTSTHPLMAALAQNAVLTAGKSGYYPNTLSPPGYVNYAGSIQALPSPSVYSTTSLSSVTTRATDQSTPTPSGSSVATQLGEAETDGGSAGSAAKPESGAKSESGSGAAAGAGAGAGSPGLFVPQMMLGARCRPSFFGRLESPITSPVPTGLAAVKADVKGYPEQQQQIQQLLHQRPMGSHSLLNPRSGLELLTYLQPYLNYYGVPSGQKPGDSIDTKSATNPYAALATNAAFRWQYGGLPPSMLAALSQQIGMGRFPTALGGLIPGMGQDTHDHDFTRKLHQLQQAPNHATSGSQVTSGATAGSSSANAGSSVTTSTSNRLASPSVPQKVVRSTNGEGCLWVCKRSNAGELCGVLPLHKGSPVCRRHYQHWQKEGSRSPQEMRDHAAAIRSAVLFMCNRSGPWPNCNATSQIYNKRHLPTIGRHKQHCGLFTIPVDLKTMTAMGVPVKPPPGWTPPPEYAQDKDKDRDKERTGDEGKEDDESDKIDERDNDDEDDVHDEDDEATEISDQADEGDEEGDGEDRTEPKHGASAGIIDGTEEEADANASLDNAQEEKEDEEEEVEEEEDEQTRPQSFSRPGIRKAATRRDG